MEFKQKYYGQGTYSVEELIRLACNTGASGQLEELEDTVAILKRMVARLIETTCTPEQAIAVVGFQDFEPVRMTDVQNND